ncbi:hypothetical protein V6N13_039978 [Hibiscus sabdariffa]|uniref:Uncharacterized protein n=1 Tax=Hibiscus sabdariffa TaxID=183260 RepID=A0ABR2STS7_9ROSI
MVTTIWNRRNELANLILINNTTTVMEAVEAYGLASIQFNELNAVTNFNMSRYNVKAIFEINTMPIGEGAAKRLKESQANVKN